VLAEPGDKPNFFVRYRVAVAVGALVSALIVAAVLATPVVVRAQLNKKAQQAGALVDVRSVRLGWGSIWLLGVTVRVPQLPSVSLQIDNARVVPTLSGRVKRVEAAGGSLQIQGSLAEVTDQWRRWRGQAASSPAPASDAAAQLQVSGLHVQWKDLVKDAADVSLWGVQASREGDAVRAAFDVARIAAQGVTLEAKAAQSVWKQTGTTRQLESVAIADLVAKVDLQEVPKLLGALGDSPAVAAAPGSTAPGPPSPAADASPRLLRLHEVRERMTSKLQTLWSEGATLQVPRVHTQLRIGEQVLNIGPARCTAERKADTWTFSFVPGANATRETLAFDVHLPLRTGSAQVSLIGGPVGLDVLGVREGDFGLQRVQDIRLSARSVITLPADRMDLDVVAEGQLERLSFLQPKLASEVVNTDRIGWSVKASWKPDEKKLQLPEGSIELGQIKARLTGELHLDESSPAAQLNFEIPLVSCQALFDSVPGSLLPKLRGTQLSGTFALSAALEVQAVKLKDMKFDWTIQNDCRIGAVPTDVAPQRFRQPFQYQIIDAAGLPLIRESGPMSRDWVPLDQISPYLEAAAIICEDSRFFSHHGIDEKAIESALIANVQAGRFVRGASTISMQLAKNLYLGHEKTLSRKLQEAVMTVLLEQELTKQQLLELYFNVIEFGPDVWGIRSAADYYFGIEPKDLSLGQALYLASILPSPSDSHSQPDGTLTPKWAEYLKKLMHIAHKIKRIDDQELELGLKEVVRVGLGKSLPPLPEAAVHGELGELPESLPLESPDDPVRPEDDASQ
jgi:hypothetical protein